MKVNHNPYNSDYLEKLISRKIEPTLDRLNELDWKRVSPIIENTRDYVELRETHAILQDEADKLAAAQKAEAEKQAGMNVVHRTFYKTIQKPVGDWWNKHFKKEPKSLEMPKQHLPFIWYD
jgi:fumarylacetoacetate (FAA) hydrolase family protein